uniref:U4/U6.U5 small nuclear ribonucleoprotein 27 kDa protein n=1 Tax=Hucho hucho TaxID=62062 RepID=A0A4W5RNY3_9TELE
MIDGRREWERRRSGSRDRERKGTLPFSGQGKAKEPLAFSSPQATLKGKTEEEIEMMKIMGFGNFDTTKGRKTDGAVNAHVINVSQKRKYRQYVNRKGGFNRPLDFIA